MKYAIVAKFPEHWTYDLVHFKTEKEAIKFFCATWKGTDALLVEARTGVKVWESKAAPA